MAQKKKAKAPSKEKNPIAQQLVARRWEKTTPEERREMLKYVASHGAGRPRTNAKRCPCGAMTLKLARIRGGSTGTSPGHKAGCPFYRKPVRPKPS